MNVKKVTNGNIKIRPTDRKIKKAKHAAESTGILPKEMPIEKKVYLVPASNALDKIKNSIEIAIENMRRQG